LSVTFNLAAGLAHASPTRTCHEIDGEIFRLYQFLSRIPVLSAFGDNNHDGIRVQLRVLREQMTAEQLTDRYENASLYIFGAALNALDWLRGNAPAPSDGWAEMLTS
jgi:hypothetical protein